MSSLAQIQNFHEAVSLALLRNRLAGQKPANITELARKIHISRTATSRAINRNALPTVQKRIASALKLPAAPLNPASTVGKPRPLPKDLLRQYFDRCQIRSTGDRAVDNYSRKLLLFRLGDYLNAYGAIAEIIAQVIGLTLCAYQGSAHTFFPSYLADDYIAQIERAGCGVRIEEPVFDEAAQSVKGGAA